MTPNECSDPPIDCTVFEYLYSETFQICLTLVRHMIKMYLKFKKKKKKKKKKHDQNVLEI